MIIHGEILPTGASGERATSLITAHAHANRTVP
jgi:hypothetical protein